MAFEVPRPVGQLRRNRASAPLSQGPAWDRRPFETEYWVARREEVEKKAREKDAERLRRCADQVLEAQRQQDESRQLFWLELHRKRRAEAHRRSEDPGDAASPPTLGSEELEPLPAGTDQPSNVEAGRPDVVEAEGCEPWPELYSALEERLLDSLDGGGGLGSMRRGQEVLAGYAFANFRGLKGALGHELEGKVAYCERDHLRDAVRSGGYARLHLQDGRGFDVNVRNLTPVLSEDAELLGATLAAAAVATAPQASHGGVARCSVGHAMKRREATVPAQYACDCCTQELPLGSFHYCEECDYALCEPCGNIKV